MKERLRIGRENDREPKNYKRKIKGRQKQKTTRNSEKIEGCDDNELERKLRLEKVVARLAVEMEEERRARLEKMVATKRLRLAMETDEERKARLEKVIATTQLRLALETEEERRAKNGLDMIWI